MHYIWILFTTHTLVNLLIIILKLRPELQALLYMDDKFYVLLAPVLSTYNNRDPPSKNQPSLQLVVFREMPF